jgi:transposase-like protein
MKTHKIDRLRHTSEKKKTMIAAYRASGLRTPRFAAHHGMNYQTLVSWIKKDRQSSLSAVPGLFPSKLISLIPAVIEGRRNPNANGAMKIFLPGGAKISITSAHHLALAVSLIRELNFSRPC